MRLLGGSAIILGEYIGDIFVHCEAKSAFGVNPVNIDVIKAGSSPVLSDVVVFLEDLA